MKHNEFARDVDSGLSEEPKQLSSKYFYDDRGSQLFQEIMELPEYYLTRAESDIFETQSGAIIEAIGSDNLHIIELGAGDGSKTIELLKAVETSGRKMIYYPVDISKEAIDQLTENVRQVLPELAIEPHVGDYFKEMDSIPPSTAKTVVLFLGANIGNYSQPKAVELLEHIGESLTTGDILLIGIDLKKDPGLISNAYYDKAGVTRKFNLNLLTRINRELNGDFNIDAFDFESGYDPDSGEVNSFIVSLSDQKVAIGAAGKEYTFKKGEKIHTELSKKYDHEEIEILAKKSGYRMKEQFFDRNSYFADCIFEKH